MALQFSHQRDRDAKSRGEARGASPLSEVLSRPSEAAAPSGAKPAAQQVERDEDQGDDDHQPVPVHGSPFVLMTSGESERGPQGDRLVHRPPFCRKGSC